MIRLFFSLLIVLSSIEGFGRGDVYEVRAGKVHFSSEAPKELISASSNQIKGALDARKKTFAFRIDISSFVGFNNALQRGHFNENYMESNMFPVATYKGKIIEDIDFGKDGVYEIRTKGKLNIHGVEQERIIKVRLTIKKGKIAVESDFTVMLTDHNIKIPRVVNDKLSPEIKVTVSASMQPMS